MKFKSFAAANSGNGFTCFFSSFLNEKEKPVYYIKGGPGCGKSTLMKEIAAKADDAELILCSGDPQSLDGIILNNAIIIDATTPHSFEPKFPGVGGSIIDLSCNWNTDSLNKKAIIELTEKKSDVYKQCYDFTATALSLHKTIQNAVFSNLDRSKIQYIGDKILRQNALWESRKKQANIKKRFFSAISPDGCVTLTDSIKTLGKNVILLEDRWHCGGELLAYMEDALKQRGIDHINAYHPLAGPKQLQHLIIPEANLSLLSSDSSVPIKAEDIDYMRRIPLSSLIDKDFLASNKNKLVFLKRMEKELLNLSVNKLSEAKSIHLKIEAEYASGIDFSKSDTLKNFLISKLFPST